MKPLTWADRLGRFLDTVRSDWREIGGWGKTAWIGVVVSLGVAVGLGFVITNAARTHLLDARVELLGAVAEDLASYGPGTPAANGWDPVAFDAEVRSRLLGGETIQVKLWARDGTILYSDDPQASGSVFDLSPLADRAFRGDAVSQPVDTDDPAHAEHEELGRIIEVYLPFGRTPDGAVASVFEIEQTVESLDAALGRIRTSVWVSISTGIAALALFLGALMVGRARVLERRRHQIEELLGALVTAQEEERRRVVGALHDDIGQPLYALLYGLEGGRRQLEPEHPVASKLVQLESVVRDIDVTLRAELRLLHEGLMADAGLIPAIEALAEATRRETDLAVVVKGSVEREPGAVPRALLFRAVREGILNVRKHAEASSVTIRIEGDGSKVRLTVNDNGTGAKLRPGLGLTTTRERLESIGGGLDVRSQPGTGTTYAAWVPLQEAGSV